MPEWIYYIVFGLIGLVLVYFVVRLIARKLRHKILMGRYDDLEMVDAIMSGKIAQGMTAEMVIDTWGDPADFDEKVMKTKTKQEMKYDQTGKNRFGTRVYLEDGVVVGWETK